MLAAVLLIALVTAGALYMRYRVNKAVAECDTPAPPEKPATPAPNLPGFAAGDACGPADAAKGTVDTPHGAVPAESGKKP